MAQSEDVGLDSAVAAARSSMISLDLASAESLRAFQLAVGLQPQALNLWSTSPERSWYLARRPKIRWRGLVPLGALLLAVVGDVFWGDRYVEVRRLALVAFAGCGVGILWSLVPYWAARTAFRERKRASATYRVDLALQEVTKSRDAGSESLPLNGLFELNRRQLDEYQEMTKRQQRMAFQLTWAAACLAFAVLVAGTALSLHQKPGTASYVVTGLTGLGALLSGFLSKTFFDQYKAAMEQLNRYYDEPARTGRLLAAERLVRALPDEQKQACVQEMITKLLAYEPRLSSTEDTTKEDAPASPSPS